MDQTIKELEQIQARVTELAHQEIKKKLPVGIEEATQFLTAWAEAEGALKSLIRSLKFS